LNGREQNTVITSSFRELTFKEIAFMADIDGDGQMEFLIRSNDIEVLSAEGFATEYQDLYDIDR
jgi:hypothetical protein